MCMKQNTSNKLLLIGILLTLSLRVGFVIFFPQPLVHGDDVGFEDMGKNFGEWLSSKESLIGASKPPMYPFFLFLIYKISGQDYVHVYWVQAILNTLTGILVYFIGCRMFKSKIPGIVGLFLFAVYPSFIWHVGILYPECLFTFLLALAILPTLIALENGKLSTFFLSGIFWGAAMLSRPVVYMFIFLLSLLIIFLYRKELIRGIKFCCFLWLGFLLISSPWQIRNYKIAGERVPVNLSKGFYLLYANSKIETDDYLGNPSYEIMGEYKQRACEKIDASQWDSPVKQDRALFITALELIKAHPYRYIKMSCIRFVRLWFNVGYGYKPSLLAYMTMAGQIVLFSLFLFWLVYFKGFLKRETAVVLLLIIYMTIIHTFTHAVYRFLIPAMPFVLLLDAKAIVNIIEKYQRRTIADQVEID